MKVAMSHLRQRAQPLVTHTLGASSQVHSPATPRNKAESPLIYVPPHKPVISMIPKIPPIQKICTSFSAPTKGARSSTLKLSPPNARTMKPSSKISDKNTAASGASFASGSHHCNSPIAISPNSPASTSTSSRKLATPSPSTSYTNTTRAPQGPTKTHPSHPMNSTAASTPTSLTPAAVTKLSNAYPNGRNGSRSICTWMGGKICGDYMLSYGHAFYSY